MKGLLLVALLLLTTGARADDGSCTVVRERSLNRITCSKSGTTYQLEYHNRSTYRIVRWSGQHQQMLNKLCEDGEVVIERIDGQVKQLVRCS